MQYLSIALPLAAFISGVLAKPAAPACANNACLAAVTGKAALGDAGLRASHCASFLATTVTPPAITVTETITGVAGKDGWKRAQVTVCPNQVPNYASACNEAAYTSACSCFGYTEIKTTTIAPTTTTKTVYIAPTWPAVVVSGSTCPGPVTSTKTVGASGWASTVTVTVTAGSGSVTPVTVTKTESGYGGWCSSTTVVTSTTTSAVASSCIVDDAKATEVVNNFIDLLEYTSYAGNAAAGIPAGRGYHYNTSAVTLDPNFNDISDSINFMAGFPLGSITFTSKDAFDYGQGVLQPEVSVSTLNIFHDCTSITWRYRLLPNPAAYPVTGINHFIIGTNGLVIKNYAEFDNGAWLQSFGQQCAINNVTVSSSPPALKARKLL